MTEYPDSNYVPYALIAAAFGAVDEKAYNRFVDAIKRFPDSPLIDQLEMAAMGSSGTGMKGLEAREAHLAKIKQSKRPTTRIVFFGREDLPKEPEEDRDE